MSDFLPDNYEIPATSNYMKFEEGENRFRILGKMTDGTAIMGTEYWKTVNDKRTPIRLKMGVPVPQHELEINSFGDLETPKHFWAIPVWNYQDKRVQILEITQATIQRALKTLANNPKWGDPTKYDIIVTRIEGKPVTYNVTPDPKEALDKEIEKIYQATQINITALYDGGDPFSSNEKTEQADAMSDAEIEDVSEALDDK